MDRVPKRFVIQANPQPSYCRSRPAVEWRQKGCQAVVDELNQDIETLDDLLQPAPRSTVDDFGQIRDGWRR
jgi:hypothetical protein